ncbi:MAG: ribosome maturation factor RimP [Candidatus Omnitrophica bacterium]|nr:ribosome maturation factor RimP [Candidatus Omnitrophota bacterium]
MNAIPEEIAQFVYDEAEKAGYLIVDIMFRRRDAAFIEIVLDKEGGITLDECGNFNRIISAWLDKENILGDRYTIDVCSPGLDRELRSPNDFKWAQGKQVQVHTYKPVNSVTVFIGKLLSSDGNNVVLGTEAGENVVLDRNNISRVKLHVSL